MRTYHESKLPNGVTLITSENPHSDIVTISILIQAGSRHENSDERGYAHLVEHMLVKETQNRPSLEALGTPLDRAGAYANASTSVESIRIKVQAAKERCAEMFELAADMTLHPLFRAEVLENEKKVVLQELHRLYDNREARIGMESQNLLFKNHPLSQNPIGDERSINEATPEKLKKYYDRMVVPKRITIIVVGGVVHTDILELTKTYFGNMPENESSTEGLRTPEKKQGLEFIKESGAQTKLYFNYICPTKDIRELVVLDFIASTLSYGKVPFLKQELRHKTGLVYTVNASVSKFKDAAVFYVSTSSTQPERVIQGVINIMESFEDAFESEKLGEFKEQFKNVLIRELDSPFYETELLWIFFKYLGQITTPKNILEIIDSITHKDLLNIKEEYLSEKNLYITVFGEKEIKHPSK
jgi:predicted Zn-dependent peptidase